MIRATSARNSIVYRAEGAPLSPSFVATVEPRKMEVPAAEPPAAMMAGNGLGGFTDEARSYAMVLDGLAQTPMPWVNVIANPHFGTIVSSSGAAHTWAGNSRENRLTPFANDPITDPTGEAIFVRDDETGQYWSPTPGPVPRDPDDRCIVTHAAGITRFTRAAHGIDHQLEVFVDSADPVKFSLLSLTNTGAAVRAISVYAYNEWVLGPPRDGDHLHVVTEMDESIAAVFARNAYNQEFSRHVAFVHTSDPAASATADRGSFIGRNGDLSHPEAMAQDVLSNQFGGGLDPCAALQVRYVLSPAKPAGCSCCSVRALTASTHGRSSRAMGPSPGPSPRVPGPLRAGLRSSAPCR